LFVKPLTWLATASVALFLSSCATISHFVASQTVRSCWIVTTDGDVTAAADAIKAAVVSGPGELLGVDDPANRTFGVKDGSLWVQTRRDDLVVTTTISETPGPDVVGRGKADGKTLVARILANASRDSRQNLQLRAMTEAEAAAFAPSFAADKSGVTAKNRHFAPYGEYLKRMADAVQTHWDNRLSLGDKYPPPGTEVIVTFVLAADGTIARISDVVSHTSKLGEDAALTALTQSAPFGSWSAEMRAHLNPLGEPLVFTFIYE
jgi:hypothetical protein